MDLHFRNYEFGEPKYDQLECRARDLTYSRPLYVNVELHIKETGEIQQQRVYMGDFPTMTEQGTFIINGAERVVVSQLHRSPGIDFVSEVEAGERRMHSCRVIPERGSWIEVNVTKKDVLSVRIDQSGKFSAMTLLRAMDGARPDAKILRSSMKPQKIVDGRGARRSKTNGRSTTLRPGTIGPARSPSTGRRSAKPRPRRSPLGWGWSSDGRRDTLLNAWLTTTFPAAKRRCCDYGRVWQPAAREKARLSTKIS
jgi:hypothetical protein